MATLFRFHFSPSQLLRPVPFCPILLSNTLSSRRTQVHPLLSLSTVPFLVQAPSPPVFDLSSSDRRRHSLHRSCISLQIKAPLCALEPGRPGFSCSHPSAVSHWTSAAPPPLCSPGAWAPARVFSLPGRLPSHHFAQIGHLQWT